MKIYLASLFFLVGTSANAANSAAENALGKATEDIVKVQVTEKGFEPSRLKVKSGRHVVLQVTRLTDATCATEIHFKERKIKMDLPLGKQVRVDLGEVKKGDIRFACGMDMISGHVIVE